MVFVDTGGWIAVTVASDSFHEVAQSYNAHLLSRRVRLFTSNYVLDDIGHADACRFCDLYEQAEERHLVTTFWVDETVARKRCRSFASTPTSVSRSPTARALS